ncbi:MAG: CsbD family protein [Candidatus Hydrogenedentes bacterium]|nr:CsbD family protein [Candidatus Hydrogenedentota bacterium]
MNWDQMKGNWKQVKGEFKRKWGKVTNDDRTIIAGQRDQLIGTFQKVYGAGKEKVEKAIGKFTRPNWP